MRLLLPKNPRLLTLQYVAPIQTFFMGGWLEWFVLATFLECINKAKDKPFFACARNMVVTCANGDKHELDVVFLDQYNAVHVFECKSGNYQTDVRKYLEVCKKLGIAPSQFYVVAPDLNQSQATTMTAMYGVTFVSMQTLSKQARVILGIED